MQPHLVQVIDALGTRRVAQVQEPNLRFLTDTPSVYALAFDAVSANKSLTDLIESRLSDETIDYESVYAGQSNWQLLPPFDHPDG